jgi:hypothetical protein
MRQSPETIQKLDELERNDRRALHVALSGATILAILLGLYFVQPVKHQREVEAVTQYAQVRLHSGEIGQRYIWIEAKLADGELVGATAAPVVPIDPPKLGEKIILKELTWWIGGRRYQWEGKLPTPAQTPR